MDSYGGYCDDYYTNLTIDTSLSLPSNRETLLSFFERLQKAYPRMKNLYVRERIELTLEEDRDGHAYRWCSLEARRITAGFLNPESMDDAFTYHRMVLQTAPFHLSLSHVDCEAIDFLMGFDFQYRGNHNQLVADALGTPSAFEPFRDIPNSQLMRFEPSLVFSLDSECRLQCRVKIGTRTTDEQIRLKEYPTENVSVYLTVRHYGCLPGKDGFEQTYDLLAQTAQKVADQYVIPSILQPLAKAISLR